MSDKKPALATRFWPFLALAGLSGGLMASALWAEGSSGGVRFWSELGVVFVGLYFFCLFRWSRSTEKKSSPWWPSFAAGWVTGLVYFGLTMHWVRAQSYVGLFFLVSYLALYWAVASALTVWVFRKIDQNDRSLKNAVHTLICATTVGGLWAGIEWARGWFLTGMPWNTWAVLITPRIHLDQLASFIGSLGLVWLLVTVVVTLIILPKKNLLGRGLIALLLFILIGLLKHPPRDGQNQTASPSAAHLLKVALVQPNIDQSIKNDPAYFYDIAKQLGDLTAPLDEPALDLVLWPESCLPSTFDDSAVVDVFQQTLDHIGTTLIAGVDEQDIDGFFNSVFVGHGQVKDGRLHRKNHLVPFGEYLPLRPLLGKIEFIKNQLPGDFQAGHSHEPIPAPAPKNLRYSLIPLVCFEDTLGRLARKFVRAEPQIMINLTNDAWFDPYHGSHIHAANARLRTIELRRPLLRATNTGLTCIIDPYGRLLEKLPTREPKTLISTIALSSPDLTFYARHGDLFTLITTLGSVLSLLYLWRTRSD